MGVKLERYTRLLKRLLPRGKAWLAEPGSDLEKLLEGTAVELERVDDRASIDLLNEADPSTTNELITDWERVTGIPDGCIVQETTLPKRREQVLSKLSARGGQSPQFFIDLAEQLGFTITISEFREFKAGESKAGDPLTNGDWVHTWRVNSAESTVTYFRAGINAAGDPIAVWGNDVLECVMKKKKPAHTIVQFSYV